MNSVLAGIQGIRCLVYLDDIVIYADTLENHSKKLREVFSRLSEYNLKLQPSKCEFLRREAMYLGHLISENGVKPDPVKVEAVKTSLFLNHQRK
jgi:Reverse transcriptase (RNA-dependent DNA polymerase).